MWASRVGQYGGQQDIRRKPDTQLIMQTITTTIYSVRYLIPLGDPHQLLTEQSRHPS